MTGPILSITIPTYNRLPLLRQTLEVLLPQLTAEVEVVVCDNCSTDGTPQYVEKLGPAVRCYRQSANLGPDVNMLSCLEHACGRYVWLLCDDDFPASNAVAAILGAIRESNPGMVYLRAQPSDARISDYSAAPVTTGWSAQDKEAFLNDVGEWVTFGSSIVVRRESIDLDFLRRQVGSALLPAALALQVAGITDQVVISDKPLLFVRGGNSGGYSAFTVFTRNFKRLLRDSARFGYRQQTLALAYHRGLTGVVPYLIRAWPLRVRGLADLVGSSWTDGALYLQLLPALARRLGKELWRWPQRVAGRLVRRILLGLMSRFGPELYPDLREQLDDVASGSFQSQVADLGPGAHVRHPFYVKNPQYMQIGAGFRAEPGLRLEAWDAFAGERWQPLIRIGRNVVLNWNVHIGAVDRVEIQDHVLVGSHVLITDHSHGKLSRGDLELTPAQRPLSSKGPVVIEERVWIGEGVCILPGVRIGRGAVIGANAVITSDVPAGAIVGGVPGRVLSSLSARP